MSLLTPWTDAVYNPPIPVIPEDIGPYRILDKLGEGGMGEVYRARDTRLARDVAIKVLPAAFTSDPDRLARFEREARTLAALNHPHIAAIYGIEEATGVRALVLELVEGETLANRIARGLKVSDALAISTADRRGARRRAREGRGAPRPQAAEHHADKGWGGQSSRLRIGEV